MDDNSQQFHPPYITVGTYNRERRGAIEAPNRETVAAIFERRRREQKEAERREQAYANHLIGIHTYGCCEWCGPRYFYD